MIGERTINGPAVLGIGFHEVTGLTTIETYGPTLPPHPEPACYPPFGREH